jgi:tetratricopeptide (TPR) repeat protein
VPEEHSFFGPAHEPAGPPHNAPVSAAPVNGGGAVEDGAGGEGTTSGSGIRVEFVEAPPPAVASGSAMGSYQSARLTGAGVDGLQATGYLPIVRPGAEGFPPELAAIAPTSPPGPRAEPAEERGPDPEQVLATFVWRFDPDTLREQIEGDEVTQLTDIRDQLTGKLNGVADNPTRARLLSLRAVVSRILGDLPKAFADGKLALAHAEGTGELRRIAIAQARLAHVLQWREEFEEADRLFTLANSSELPDRLRATMHQHAGKCAYDQGRYMEACNHFESALDLRKEEDPELIAQTELALDAVFRRVAEKGWGPYPRSREEILQIRKAPSPAFDEQTQRWGYIEPDGNFVIGPGYLDVQPFRDGVAWVQRQGSQTWELIDDSGRVVIEPSAGYIGVGSFSDGLAWVSHDGTTRWIAIDKNNTVLISTGFDDVRPFRRGVAAVRRGEHWGAVDGVGRIVVQFQYDGFATALLDGRYIDGFSDEGLAVVSLDGRKGVVDRSGRVLVPPVHHTIMIHPVAFLIVDDSQRWGALDRRGRAIIQATFPSRVGVTDEIDRLLADTRPVM